MTDAETQQLISKELAPGERLLWSGRPKGGLVFRGADIFLVPFSIVWFSGVLWVFILSFVREDFKEPPFPFSLVLPFMLVIGIYFVVGRFIVDIWQRANTYYGLTPERIIIVYGFIGKQAKSVNLKATAEIQLKERSNGSGTVSFATGGFFGMMPNAGMHWWGWLSAQMLELDSDARKVYDLIREAQRAK